jgi:hypothetical protein
MERLETRIKNKRKPVNMIHNKKGKQKTKEYE